MYIYNLFLEFQLFHLVFALVRWTFLMNKWHVPDSKRNSRSCKRCGKSYVWFLRGGHTWPSFTWFEVYWKDYLLTQISTCIGNRPGENILWFTYACIREQLDTWNILARARNEGRLFSRIEWPRDPEIVSPSRRSKPKFIPNTDFVVLCNNIIVYNCR